jgi:hypothetical protein
MASFTIRWKSSALRELRKLPAGVVARVLAVVEALAQDPFPQTSRSWQGRRTRTGFDWEITGSYMTC